MFEGSGSGVIARRLASIPTWRILVIVGLAAALLLGVGSLAPRVFAQGGWDSITRSPTVVAVPPAVAISSKSRVTFIGSGFEPGGPVSLLLIDKNGIMSDLTATLEANEDGAFITTWTLGRHTRIADEGLFSLRAVGEDFNVIATTPIALCKSKRPEGEKAPPYCAEGMVQ